VRTGRALQELDDDSRDGLVAVISHRLWRDRFDESPRVLGRAAVINGVPATIVGVAAPGFLGALRSPDEDLWLPIRSYHRSTNKPNVLADRSQPRVLIAGRLSPAASLTQARAELSALLPFADLVPRGRIVRMLLTEGATLAITA
jgi:hypothetical protein